MRVVFQESLSRSNVKNLKCKLSWHLAVRRYCPSWAKAKRKTSLARTFGVLASHYFDLDRSADARRGRNLGGARAGLQLERVFSMAEGMVALPVSQLSQMAGL